MLIARQLSRAARRVHQVRQFSAYAGQNVTDDDLVKKSDDWAIEETNFCLGRTSQVRYQEEDDLARRTLLLIESQTNRMHTRLRDGTCIPVQAVFLDEMVDKPAPAHIFVEMPLLKWTWDGVYEEAFDRPAE
eukprot:GEMP01042926.1.p1 GENE.GEMP01042926.1~~GEMP01042926.1.p1  ORF type:complete len:132 (+),score=18.48 GEMP01042926.1:61-456(+)